MGYCREVLERLGPAVSAGLQAFPNAIRDDLLELHRTENAATATRLLKTAGLADFRIKCLRTLGVSEHLLRELAITDIAIATTCTETVATTYLNIGDMLTHRTPKIAAAFLHGDLDYRRVATLATTLEDIEAHTIAGIEDQLLAAARTLTPGPLQREAERILIAHDPDLAAQRHKVGKARRRTRRRNAPFGMAWFEAFLTADEAINLEAMITELAHTVCRHDPREAGQRNADAFLALTRGEHCLPCRCARPDCPHRDETSRTPRNKPHVYVHADLATLMQLANNPAVLAGYGPICPDYARLLAEDATWQLLITEGVKLAEHWKTLHPDAATDDTGVNTDLDADPPVDAAPDPDAPAPATDEPVHREAATATEDTTEPDPTSETASPDPEYLLDPEYEDHPTASTGIHPDGHGGYAHPPDGALTYRPTAAQKAIVRARDGHCRFPACTRPAATCEIDHMVPFNHTRPRAGGWTIEANLHCLCKHHHQLKTGRLWTTAGLAGAAEIWTSITGLVQITLPAGFRTTITPPQFHLDRTPLPPIDRPPEQRAEDPPPEEPDPRDTDRSHGSAEPPPF